MYSLGIRAKLIIIFILIKVLPLLTLAWFAWQQVSGLVTKIQSSYQSASIESQEMGKTIVSLASKDSIRALDVKSQELIERLASDTAKDVARFLYERDHDIEQAAITTPSDTDYHTFLTSRIGPIVEHGSFTMDETGTSWKRQEPPRLTSRLLQARNSNNAKDFNYHPPETAGTSAEIPLYLEMTFVDLIGQEQVKVTTSDRVKPELYDVSNKENTYCKAETYFKFLKELKPG